MNRSVIASLVALFVWTAPAAGWAEAVISSGNQDYPPSSWAEGEAIVGVAADLLQLILQDNGLTGESKFLGPWKRVQHLAMEGNIDILTTIYRNPEREAFYNFTDIPYMDDQNVVWVAKGKEFPFEKWDDLIGKRGTAVLGDSYGPEFDKFIVEKLTMERVAQVEQNFKKLVGGRSDYMPYGLYSGMIASRIHGMDAQLSHLPHPLLSEGLYFAVSKKSSHAGIAPLLTEGIKKYRADGTIEKLIQQHLEKYLSGVKR